MNKPHRGLEAEYRRTFKLLIGEDEQKLNIIDKLRGKKVLNREQLLQQFLSISSTAYETLNAPQVGLSEEATKWAESKFEKREDKSLTFEVFMNQMQGFYVLDLVPECDGIPMYIAMHDEAHIFRAQFLRDCEDILGPELFEMAYESKLTEETAEYAKKLKLVAEEYAEKNNCVELSNQRSAPDTDEDSPESKAHILYSAVKWLEYWSSRGHGMEADY